jgi:hypothetical protein
LGTLRKPLTTRGEFVKFKRFYLGASALSTMLLPVQSAIAQTAGEKPGSAYVQCDGQPNNVTTGETAARLIGAVTLLGLFAPPPESPDASKRKMGLPGVAACTSLLEGDRAEGNANRRLGLLLGRAIHRIEAKDYAAAITDVAQARREAEAAGLMTDAYFAHSRGRAFDLVESAALFRLGRVEDARAAGLRSASALEYSMLGLFSTPTYDEFIATMSPEEDRFNQWRSRLVPALSIERANRLDIAGRFAESARIRDAYIEFDAEHTPEINNSAVIAQAAVAHALAGNVAVAAERASAARANAAKRKADGKPETDAAEYVELMDLYGIIETARTDPKAARRLFSARSQWVGASLGSVLEVNRRLREGATADELIGGMAKDSAQLWKEQADTGKAAVIAKDSDNKTLFYLVPAARNANGYYPLSKTVWRTDKSKIILKSKSDPAKNKMELMYLPLVDPTIAMEAYVLHAALIARSRGHQGFVFSPIVSGDIIAASFRSGNRGQKGFAEDLFIPADDVIAKLAAYIPDPATLKARQAAK